MSTSPRKHRRFLHCSASLAPPKPTPAALHSDALCGVQGAAEALLRLGATRPVKGPPKCRRIQFLCSSVEQRGSLGSSSALRNLLPPILSCRFRAASSGSSPQDSVVVRADGTPRDKEWALQEYTTELSLMASRKMGTPRKLADVLRRACWGWKLQAFSANISAWARQDTSFLNVACIVKAVLFSSTRMTSCSSHSDSFPREPTEDLPRTQEQELLDKARCWKQQLAVKGILCFKPPP